MKRPPIRSLYQAATDRTRVILEALVSRLARLHFADNVCGQTPPFKEQEVETALLRRQVRTAEGTRVSLYLEGDVWPVLEGVWLIDDKADAENPQLRRRGFDAQLVDYARWDGGSDRFVDFDLLVMAVRWGGTQYNRRHDDLVPVGVALTLAGATSAEWVAPANFWDDG